MGERLAYNERYDTVRLSIVDEVKDCFQNFTCEERTMEFYFDDYRWNAAGTLFHALCEEYVVT